MGTRERTFFVGGPWHRRKVAVERMSAIRVHHAPPRLVHPPELGSQPMREHFFEAFYRLERWRTARGEEFCFYCAPGEQELAEDVLRPVSEVLDVLEPAFGPNRLFLAIGLVMAHKEFVLDLLRVKRKHGLGRCARKTRGS